MSDDMQIGFILPSARDRMTISRFQARIDAMRPDQVRYFQHLLRSWGIFRTRHSLGLIGRAYRRTMNERP